MVGYIERRSKDTWRVVMEVAPDPITGRRRRRKVTVRGTKRDARRALTEARSLRDHGIDIEPSRITLAEYLERWLRDYAEPNVAPSTLKRYRGICRVVAESLGELRLQALRPAHIQAMYSHLRERPLAPRTILHHHRVLKEALRHAVGWQLIERNPADAVSAPRAQRKEMQSLDTDGVERLLDACEGGDQRRLICTAVFTGLRLGELLGLRWDDLDLEARTATVRRTAQYLGPDGVKLRAPKTARSRRTISLSPSTVALLRGTQGRAERTAAAIGTSVRGSGNGIRGTRRQVGSTVRGIGQLPEVGIGTRTRRFPIPRPPSHICDAGPQSGRTGEDRVGPPWSCERGVYARHLCTCTPGPATPGRRPDGLAVPFAPPWCRVAQRRSAGAVR